MGKRNDNSEWIQNEDGSSLRVDSGTNEQGSYAMVVHEFDSSGNEIGHVTDPSNNPSVHVTDSNGEQHCEAGYNPDDGTSNPSPYNYEGDDGTIETELI